MAELAAIHWCLWFFRNQKVFDKTPNKKISDLEGYIKQRIINWAPTKKNIEVEDNNTKIRKKTARNI